jgi:CheY-like chemotaxis protein
MVTAAHAEATLPTVLVVDDEPVILALLRRFLTGSGHFQLATADDGTSALRAMHETPPPAVVIADMQMPGIDGIELLSQIQQISPNTIRILLTGNADLESAIRAVNVGQVFRFLTKPCEAPLVRAATAAALEQHRLIVADRVLHEETLQGTIKALVDVLALTNGVSFRRATRLKQQVSDLAEKLGVQSRWQVEVAAMLSQLGYVTLPADVADRVYHQKPLSRDEIAAVERLPSVTEMLLAHIPSLEVVRGILGAYLQPITELPPPGVRHHMLRGAQLLRVASDFDTLSAQGHSAAAAVGILRRRAGLYAPDVLDALADLRIAEAREYEVRELSLSDIRPGMVLADDLTTAAGALLVTRGYKVTPNFLNRCHDYPAGWLKEPIRVEVAV